MKSLSFVLAFALFVSMADAQTTPTVTPARAPARTNRVDRTLNKANTSLNSANTSVNNASATGTNAVTTATNATTAAKNFATQVNTLFKKPSDGVVNTTQITVKNANFAKVKKLTAALLSCNIVQDAKMKFSPAGSTVTVTHSGSTTKLLQVLQKKSDLVTDDAVDNVDEGIIALTLK
ncbi:MAG: hypothetical protein JST19_19060 [Bacteroidetes bacterium]|nr:hypothetical protein [Bacteroidota bacterium]